MDILADDSFQRDSKRLHELMSEGSIERLLTFLNGLPENRVRKLLTNERIDHYTDHYHLSKEATLFLKWAVERREYYNLLTPPAILMISFTKDREGAQDEIDVLNDMFRNFTPIQPLHLIIKKDLSRLEICESIRELHSDGRWSALFVVIMGHGVDGGVLASDGWMALDEILQEMDGPKLKGKPKVLIVQACQPITDSLSQFSDQIVQVCRKSTNHLGSVAYLTQMMDAALAAQLPADANPPKSLSGNPKKITAAAANFSSTRRTHPTLKAKDFALVMATIQGEFIMRNEMIPAFAKVFESSLAGTDIHEIFVRVNQIVNAKLGQVAEFGSTLTRKLCLQTRFHLSDSQDVLASGVNWKGFYLSEREIEEDALQKILSRLYLTPRFYRDIIEILSYKDI